MVKKSIQYLLLNVLFVVFSISKYSTVVTTVSVNFIIYGSTFLLGVAMTLVHTTISQRMPPCAAISPVFMYVSIVVHYF